MATLNPRITVTLTPEIHAVMRRLSELTGNSQSSIVGELLGSSMPALVRVVKVMEAAENAQTDLREGIASGLAQAQERIEAQLGLALGALDEATLPIIEQSEKIHRRGRKVLTTPVSVTRGSGRGKRDHPVPEGGSGNA